MPFVVLACFNPQWPKLNFVCDGTVICYQRRRDSIIVSNFRG
jgi:hypothetical protein